MKFGLKINTTSGSALAFGSTTALTLSLGINLWVKVWWTNRNPKLITSYYIEAARKLGCIDIDRFIDPFLFLTAILLITQSDAGTENFGTANCHTTARHRLDPSLADTLQHRWMRNKTNIKNESNWSVLRRDFTPGFENVLDDGVNRGLYNVDDPLERYVD